MASAVFTWGCTILSDILAGYVLGVLGLALGASATYLPRPRVRWPEHPRPSLRLTAACAGLGLWLFAIVALNVLWPAVMTPPQSLSPQLRSCKAPVQQVLGDDEAYVHSIVGTNEAPINLFFTAASSQQVQSCLVKAGWLEADAITWRTVSRAYFRAYQGKPYPRAPLSPWFWKAEPQDLGLVYPGPENKVFDRGFLRVWSTGYRLPSGAPCLSVPWVSRAGGIGIRCPTRSPRSIRPASSSSLT